MLRLHNEKARKRRRGANLQALRQNRNPVARSLKREGVRRRKKKETNQRIDRKKTTLGNEIYSLREILKKGKRSRGRRRQVLMSDEKTD